MKIKQLSHCPINLSTVAACGHSHEPIRTKRERVMRGLRRLEDPIPAVRLREVTKRSTAASDPLSVVHGARPSQPLFGMARSDNRSRIDVAVLLAAPKSAWFRQLSFRKHSYQTSGSANRQIFLQVMECLPNYTCAC